jgi:hypothetical protein
VLQLLPLALGSAVYPTLLAVVILILTQPNPRRLLAAYLAGAMLTSLAIGLVIVGGLGTGHLLNGSSGHTINPAWDLVVGLLLLALLYALLTGRDRRLAERRERKRAEGAKSSKKPWSDRVLRAPVDRLHLRGGHGTQPARRRYGVAPERTEVLIKRIHDCSAPTPGRSRSGSAASPPST